MVRLVSFFVILIQYDEIIILLGKIVEKRRVCIILQGPFHSLCGKGTISLCCYMLWLQIMLRIDSNIVVCRYNTFHDA